MHQLRTKILTAGAIFFLISAWFSEGYHHPDEHFQILEFAGFRLGDSPAAELPWEFQARIRPALQPSLAAGLIKGMRLSGMDNPFTQARVLRLLSALLSFLIFARLIKTCHSGALPAGGSTFVLPALVFLLWFVPYLQVRFSSECWSGLVFLAAVSMLLPQEEGGVLRPRALFVAGALLGLSFFFRFQLGFAILGIFAWLIKRKVPVRDLAGFVAGGFTAGAAGLLLDSWFYGEWVCTPYEYFKVNIFENKAADWGVSPWWFYFTEFVAQGIPPISLMLLGLFLAGLYRQRQHLFAWAFVPYFLAHMVVGHKELRFLFPMLFPFLFFVAAGWHVAGESLSKYGFWKIGLRLCLVVNGLLLFFRCLTPAQEAVPYLHFMYDYAQKQPTTIFSEKTPAFQLVGLNLNFYTPKNTDLVVIPNCSPLADYAAMRARSGDLLLFRRPALPAMAPEPERIYSIFPDWILQNNTNGWQDRSRIWSIYRF